MTTDRRRKGGKTWWLSMTLAALTGLATSCAENVSDVQEQRTANGRTAVTFGAQTRRGTTRAGVAGAITTDALKTGTHAASGFGVFAYYNDNGAYDGQGWPDFMYNQQVKWNSDESKWKYTPLMYWPNENGATGESEGTDRLSFFAYAPWVDADIRTGTVTGDATKGIVGMTNGSATGDPALRYVTSWNPSESVDLLWGTGSAGLPHLNLTKPAMDEKVSFTMRHALAKLNLQVDAAVDSESPSSTEVDHSTHVWVRSVTLTGIAPQGELCLNNTVADKPRWSDYGGGTLVSAPVTIYDGRYDGQEALYAATGEPLTGLNPVVVQSAHYGNSALTAGVTHTAVNLLNSTNAEAPVYVIPTGAPMNVTITYDVETPCDVDGYLSDGTTLGTSVQNTITKNAVLPALEAGKAYNVQLHLGLTSVEVDAAVTAWDSSGDGTDVNTDLSANEWSGLTFEAAEDGCTVRFKTSQSIEYSKDLGHTWTESHDQNKVIRLEKTGDKVLFRGSNSKYGGSQTFEITGKTYVYGNVMSLVTSNFETAMELDESNNEMFGYLFAYNRTLMNHPTKDIVLPAIKLATRCYQRMFAQCDALTRAPELPATEIADYCYFDMFCTCKSLKSGPKKLPAKVLKEDCYYEMFHDCTALVNAPEIEAEVCAQASCNYMFGNCTSLTTAPALLPAMTLANNCYGMMFYSCTSLTTAPVLPATTLVSGCYGSMFKDCTNLSYVKAMFTTTPSSSYTSGWLTNVKANGTFVKNSAATWDETGDYAVPSGWTIETAEE